MIVKILHILDPRPVVVGQRRLHRVQHAVRHGVALCILQHTQPYGLPLLVRLFNVARAVQLCVRQHHAAGHQVLHAVLVLQEHVQTAQL